MLHTLHLMSNLFSIKKNQLITKNGSVIPFLHRRHPALDACLQQAGGIQFTRIYQVNWIPAFAGMTDGYGIKLPLLLAHLA
jgi:hypothetical protein